MTAYILEPGSSGNNVDAPHKSSLNLSAVNSLLVVGYVAYDKWLPTAQGAFFSVFDTAADGMVRCGITPTGTMQMTVSVAGAAGNGTTTTVLKTFAGIADGDGCWVWYMWQANDGTVDFRYSLDPPETAIGSVVWTNVQVNRASAISGIATTSTALIRIGGYNTSGATQPFAGKVYRAQMYVGTAAAATLASTLVVDCDPSKYSGTGSTFVSGGDTWTIRGTASVVGAVVPASPFWGIKNYS